jgi:hypothetical protein
LRKFFFFVRSPEVVVSDDKGIEFTSEADARDYAARLISELLEDPVCTGMGFEIAVQDETGKELFIVPFDQAHLH